MFFCLEPLPENFDPSAFHHVSLTVDEDGVIKAVFDETTLIHEPGSNTSMPSGGGPIVPSFDCSATAEPFTHEFNNFSITAVILRSSIKATKIVEASNEIRALAVSPDGKFLAAGGAGGQIVVHNQNTWETVAEYIWQDATIPNLKLTP